MSEEENFDWDDLENQLAEAQKSLENLLKNLENAEETLGDTEPESTAVKAEEFLGGITPNPPSGEAGDGKSFRLPEDYPAPREILRQHFPRTADQCNFSGGWGYDADHATVVKEFDPEINPDEKFDGVSLEYAFIDKRIREELIFSRQEGDRYVLEDPTYTTIEQNLLDIDGVPFDRVVVEVTAYPEKEWNELKADWESHGGYADSPEGREANLARKEGIKLTYRTEYFFNISDFLGD